MKRVVNGVVDLIIFTIAFFTQEILNRNDIINTQDSLWIDFISFIAIFLVVYVIVKVAVFYMRRSKKLQNVQLPCKIMCQIINKERKAIALRSLIT